MGREADDLENVVAGKDQSLCNMLFWGHMAAFDV